MDGWMDGWMDPGLGMWAWGGEARVTLVLALALERCDGVRGEGRGCRGGVLLSWIAVHLGFAGFERRGGTRETGLDWTGLYLMLWYVFVLGNSNSCGNGNVHIRGERACLFV
jgi:hypothetical protein